MKTTILDSLIRRQEAELEKQKQVSREKIARGKEPTKGFSLKRQTKLLRVHDSHDPAWAFCVPPYFNDALDIRLMERVQVKNKKIIRRYLEWSQGSLFGFSLGDVIYDVYLDPKQCWAEHLKVLNIALQFKQAASADLSGEGDSAYRFPGHVECAVFTPNGTRSEIIERGRITMTQDELVRVLIAGPNKDMLPLLNTTKFAPDGQGLLF